jgi:hypothetical protein
LKNGINKVILLSISIFLVTSCVTSNPSTPARISLNSEAIPRIVSSDVFIGFGDDEINPFNRFNISKYTLGGFVPALIDVIAKNSMSKEYINPNNIREVLEDHKGKELFTEKLKLKLQSVEWLRINEVSLANTASNKMYDVYYSLSKASTVLFITTYYSFSEDYKTLKITSSIKLFPKDENLKSFAYSWSDNEDTSITDNNCIYKSVIVHEKHLKQEVADKDAAILLWASNNAKLLRETIDSGTDEISEMIVTDLMKIANKGAPLDRAGLPRSQ